MKILTAVCTLLASLVYVSGAFAAAELSVVEGTYNFGTIPQGKKVQHDFVIKNSGDAPLIIRDISTSCGCTAAKPSAQQIQPGKSAEIQVVFDSTNFFGKVQKTVTVLSNAGKAPRLTLVMEGTISEELQLNPRQLSLGPLKAGQTRQVNLTISNQGERTVHLLSVTSNSNTLQIKAQIKKGELRPGEAGTIEVSVAPRSDAKILSGYLHLVTDSPQKKEITIPVYASQAK